jgi:MFS family permease
MTSKAPTAPRERWTATDSWAFWAFGLGMLLENYIFSLAPIADGWVRIPSAFTPFLPSWAPLWLIIGIAVSGPLADRIGRKTMFYLNASLYALGALGLIFAVSNALTLFIFLAVVLFAAGGEMNTVMIATHELMPAQHRSKAMMLELNFINLGGLILAVLAFASGAWSNSVSLQKLSVGIALLIALGLLAFFRTRTPESLRWLISQGRQARAREIALHFYGPEEGQRRYQAVLDALSLAPQSGSQPVSVVIRLYATTAMAFAGAAGFGLMTYVIGPYYFSSLTAVILVVAGFVGFVSGLIGFWADRLSRRTLLFGGYLGALVLTLLVYLTAGDWSKDVVIFWLFLVLMNMFINVAYLAEDTLKGEVWPTHRRGTYTALVRFIAIGLYIVTIYLTAHFNLRHTMLFSVVVWAIGASGALVWYVKGVETGQGTPLDAFSRNVERPPLARPTAPCLWLRRQGKVRIENPH